MVAERFRHAARALAALHQLSPAELRLHDEPVAPADEVDKWCRALSTVDRSFATGLGKSPPMPCTRRAPPPVGPAIVHGDFRLGNLLADERGITAVIDWEIWSVGDPRVDVGWS